MEAARVVHEGRDEYLRALAITDPEPLTRLIRRVILDTYTAMNGPLSSFVRSQQVGLMRKVLLSSE
jgi:hypothetical protein